MAGFYKSVTAQIDAAVADGVADCLKVRRWTGAAFEARGATEDFGVVFLSSNDDTGVTAPSDGNLVAGDLFIAHPDSP